jgi:hypothetical protein
MPATYEPIATTTLSTTSASITFSSIAATYTDLKIVLIGTLTVVSNPRIQFNSDTANNYNYTFMRGNGATAAPSVADTTVGLLSVGNLDTTIPGMISIDVFGYAGTSRKAYFSTFSLDKNTTDGSGTVGSIVGLWNNTAAITQVAISSGGTTFKAGTTATLYGIKAA